MTRITRTGGDAAVEWLFSDVFLALSRMYEATSRHSIMYMFLVGDYWCVC